MITKLIAGQKIVLAITQGLQEAWVFEKGLFVGNLSGVPEKEEELSIPLGTALEWVKTRAAHPGLHVIESSGCDFWLG